MKIIEDIQRKKATGDESIPMDLPKELADSSGLKITTVLVNKESEGDWPNVLLDDALIALAKRWSDHWAISLISHTGKIVALISHTGKIVARLLCKRLASKIKEVIEEDLFGFLKVKCTRDAIGLMRIMPGCLMLGRYVSAS